MSWIYEGEVYAPETLDGLFGFVYEIEELSTGRLYIGRRNFFSIRKVKGFKRRQRRESDWQSYYSSHKGLKAAAKANPADYQRIILHLCTSEGQLNFMEVREQFLREVLIDPRYLNDNISGKWFKANVTNYF